jgi:fructokinase
MATLTGGIEAGGSKFVCAVGTGPNDLVAETRFPTTTPDETIGRASEFFSVQQRRLGPLAAIGVGSFGPVDLNPASSRYGYITSTPKPHWSNTDFVGRIRNALGVPVAFDTDVNAAALGEWRWGAAQGLDTFIYLTVGTGLGGGGMVNGRRMRGLVHPEMGHVRVPRDIDDGSYRGFCAFHGDCLEGLTTGPAIEDRWGVPADRLPPDHPAWHLEAEYLALGLVNFICALSPERIVMGGGVMQQRHLFPRIQSRVQSLLNGYVRASAITEAIDSYIVAPGLGSRSGLLGAIALAQELAD